MKSIDLIEIFDLNENNILNKDDIQKKIMEDKPFLGKINYNYKKNNVYTWWYNKRNIINRDGDILFGIKNNELETITVNILDSCLIDNEIVNREILETLVIKSGEIKYLKLPLILIMLYKNNIIIEINKENESLYSYFFQNIEYKIDLVYGYLTNDLREYVSHNFVYLLNNKDIHMYINGYLKKWIYSICWVHHPPIVNQEFYDNYMSNKYTPDEIFEKFEELNKNWLKLNVKNIINTT